MQLSSPIITPFVPNRKKFLIKQTLFLRNAVILHPKYKFQTNNCYPSGGEWPILLNFVLKLIISNNSAAFFFESKFFCLSSKKIQYKLKWSRFITALFKKIPLYSCFWAYCPYTNKGDFNFNLVLFFKNFSVQNMTQPAICLHYICKLIFQNHCKPYNNH